MGCKHQSGFKKVVDKLGLDVEIKADTPPPRIVTYDGTLVYDPEFSKLQTPTHRGQYKLFTMEYEFLQKCVKELGPNLRVLYAGAAPGYHIPVLMQMFPTFHFTLIDPAPFCPPLQNHLCTINDFFTDQMAQDANGRYDVFISDIRSGLPNNDTVIKDLVMQGRWYKLVNAKLTMLKFRLPWPDYGDVVPFYKGEEYYQIFEKSGSAETRLVLRPGASVVDYDLRLREEHMCYFNNLIRPRDYNGVCYDCAVERLVYGDRIEQVSELLTYYGD
jgi:cap2 methyltransferase